MGLKKIAAKRVEYENKEKALTALLGAAQQLQEALTKIQKLGEEAEKAFKNAYAQKSKMATIIEKLDTLGVKEFEHYKNHLLAIAQDRAFQERILPAAPLKKVVEDARALSKSMMNEWLEKQAAAMPKEWKKGMSFKDYTLNRVYELISDVEMAKNDSLKGDDAQWFKVKFTDIETGKEQTSEISKGTLLKNKLKYIKM